ncbi:succinylglutamate desuccinylase/aspartoacylase domain-containing protein [Natronomonas marina]|jgi:predicted deacylase|uniref:succinylglutamate desuccinylase/aspartoacylase domain-containing protein n=1 Tax=Natronomonas marina TaxID=2961939 RepID=UPI0020C98482|nr:succinylglutamate desuccinylase/aspartoacylase family protein [Natronomonas marina]
MTEASPDVTVHGPGDPELAVVGGVHGDEPSGVRAVERLRDADLSLRRGVKFVVANPPAVEAGQRYLETDLNRSFPGDSDGSLEERLAARLCAETAGLPTLSLHATHSTPDPIALVEHTQPAAFDLAGRLPVPHVVDHHRVTDGSFTDCGTVVTVEAGCQGTDAAADEAERQARAFLAETGALPTADHDGTDPNYYVLEDAVEKPSGVEYELLAENFTRVAAGAVFATAGEERLVAHRPFYPVLMSECGYEEIFGYRASRLGTSPAGALAVLGVDPAAE